MNEPLMIISMLTIALCNLGVIWLYLMLHNKMDQLQDDSLLRLALDRLASSAARERRILQRIGQVKTRLADEEREDQKAKRQVREGVQA